MSRFWGSSRPGEIFRKAEGQGRPRNSRRRLTLERLEQRAVPSIVFGSYPSVTTSDGGGPVIDNVHVELIFWGSQWTATPRPTPSPTAVENAVDNILGSGYLSGLSQYRSSVGNGSRVGTVLVTDSSPPSQFTNANVNAMLQTKIYDGTLPAPGTDSQLLYMVIPQSGCSDPVEGLPAEHSFSSVGLDGKYRYGWTGNDGTLDTVTRFFSHELAEAVTDPEGTAIQISPPNTATWNEIGDGTAESYKYRLNNTLVQAYWSQQDQAYIVPTGPTTLPPTGLGTVARALTHSEEYYTNFVTSAYQKYLGRLPDPAGWNSWVMQMEQGLTDERLEAGFAASVEYIALHGGDTRAWLIGLYHDLLGRSPSDAEVSGWLGSIAKGATFRQVAYGFTASDEREGQRITAYYQSYLGRLPEPGAVAGWIQVLHNGVSNEDLIDGFVASAEYFKNQKQNNLVDWLFSAYQGALGRSPDAVGQAVFLNYLEIT
jgi:hypothetical protein